MKSLYFKNTFSGPFCSDFSRPEGIPCSLFNQCCCVCSTPFPPVGEVLELIFFKSFHYLILEGQGTGSKWKIILPSGTSKPTISKFCRPSYMAIMTYNFKIPSLSYGFWHYSFNIVSVGEFRNIVLIILCCKTLFCESFMSLMHGVSNTQHTSWTYSKILPKYKRGLWFSFNIWLIANITSALWKSLSVYLTNWPCILFCLSLSLILFHLFLL